MRFIHLVVLSLFLASNLIYSDVKCAETSSQTSAEQPDAGVILIPSSTGTYLATQKPRNPDRPYIERSSRIIKIGPTYTKGRDLKEMQKLLTGQNASKIQVTLLGIYGDLSVVELECKPESLANAGAYKPDYRMRYFENGEKDSLYPIKMALNVHSLLIDGAVLQIAGAFTSYIQEYPLAYQRPAPISSIERLPATAEFFTTTGMFDRLDDVAKYALKLLKDPNNSFNRTQLQAITQASVILHQYSNSDAVMALVTEAEKKAPSSSLPKHLNPDWLLRPQPDQPGGYAVTSKIVEIQDELSDVYKKANNLLDNNELTEARAILIAELNKVLSSENPQIIVSMERAITPCVSDLEILLTRVNLRSGANSEAKMLIDRAIKRIEDAVGKDSPCLHAPLYWSRSAEKALGNANAAKLISARVSELSPIAPSSHLSTDVITKEETAETHRAYSLIQNGKLDEAKKTVDDLLLQEKKKDTHDPLSIVRFISLANTYSKNAHKKEALELLNELSPMLQDDKAMMLKIYQLAEIAVLSSDASTRAKSHAPWKELEHNLAEVMEPGSTKFEAGYPENTEVKRQDRLRKLAIAYCLNNEPDKAVKLMRHGLKEHHVERSPEPISQMDFAFCLLKVGDFEGAQKAIDASFKDASSLDSMPFYESLSRVAQYYLLLGKLKESEALFLRGVEADKNSRHAHGCAYLLVRLADLQASTGRYEEAEKNYKLADSKPEGTTVFPDWQLRLANATRLKNGVQPIPLEEAQQQQLRRRPRPAVNAEPEPPADSDNTPWAIRQRLMNQGKCKELAAVLLQAMKQPDAPQQLRNMDHPGNILHDVYYDTLMKGGEYKGLEDLLKQAIKVRTVIAPKPGDHAVLYKGLLLKFYANRKENSRANVVAEDLFMDLDSKSEMTKASQIQSYYPFKFINDAAEECIANGQYGEAEKLLNRTRALQKKWLGSENEQQVETLTVLSRLYEKTGRSALAEQSLKRAFEIVCWLRGAESRYSSMIRNEYAGILRKNGKPSDAEFISSYKPSEEQQPAFDWDYGNNGLLRTTHSAPPKHFKDSAEKQLLHWLARAKRISGHIGNDTLYTLDKLVSFYKDRKRYREAQQYLAEKLDIWNKVEGRCSKNRSQVMLEIVRNRIDDGDRKSASEWLAKAINEESSERNEWFTPKLLVSYALLHTELGQMPKADYEAITALNMLENRGNFPNVGDVDLIEDIAKVFARTKNAAYVKRLEPWIEKCQPLKKTIWYQRMRY